MAADTLPTSPPAPSPPESDMDTIIDEVGQNWKPRPKLIPGPPPINTEDFIALQEAIRDARGKFRTSGATNYQDNLIRAVKNPWARPMKRFRFTDSEGKSAEAGLPTDSHPVLIKKPGDWSTRTANPEWEEAADELARKFVDKYVGLDAAFKNGLTQFAVRFENPRAGKAVYERLKDAQEKQADTFLTRLVGTSLITHNLHPNGQSEILVDVPSNPIDTGISPLQSSIGADLPHPSSQLARDLEAMEQECERQGCTEFEVVGMYGGEHWREVVERQRLLSYTAARHLQTGKLTAKQVLEWEDCFTRKGNALKRFLYCGIDMGISKSADKKGEEDEDPGVKLPELLQRAAAKYGLTAVGLKREGNENQCFELQAMGQATHYKRMDLWLMRRGKKRKEWDRWQEVFRDVEAEWLRLREQDEFDREALNLEEYLAQEAA